MTGRLAPGASTGQSTVDELLRALVTAGIIDQDTADVMRRRLDPVAFRAWAETEMERAVQAGLTAQQGRLVEFLRRNDYRPTNARWAAFWQREDRLLWQSMERAFVRVGGERHAAAVAQITPSDLTFDLPNLDAREWVNGYYTSPAPLDHGSVPNLDATSREQVRDVFNRWINGDLEGAAAREQGIPALIRALEPTFGPERARRIAVTESTRIFVEGQRQAEADDEFVTMFRMTTSRDERVCPICGPLDGAVRPKTTYTYDHPQLGPIAGPPFHVNCRCGETPETKLTVGVREMRSWTYSGPEVRDSVGNKDSGSAGRGGGGGTGGAPNMAFLNSSLQSGDVVITRSGISYQDLETKDGSFRSQRVTYGTKKWYYKVVVDGKTKTVNSLSDVYGLLERHLKRNRV